MTQIRNEKFQWYNSGAYLDKSTLYSREVIESMLDKITGIEERYEELNQLLMEVGDDYQRAAELGKERSELEPFINKSQRYRQAIQQLEEARILSETEDEEFRNLALS